MGVVKVRIARPFSREAALKRSIRNHLRGLGFEKGANGQLSLPRACKDAIRAAHGEQRRESIAASHRFLQKALPRALGCFADGHLIEPSRIKLCLRRVRSGTLEADVFRVATLTWSVPVSPGFGRRIRYLVWDEEHNRAAGVIALGDPVYNLAARDSLIGWTAQDRSERLVNVLDAYVLGAVPPYNMLLGGKAIACLVRSRDIYEDFAQSYGNSVGIISSKAKNARLVAVTTSSSLGRSSIYNRLRISETDYFKRIGYTEGWGHFHVGRELFDDMKLFLRDRAHSYPDSYNFGEGPNWRLRTIRVALAELNLSPELLRHGVRREVFMASLATNASDVLRTGTAMPEISDLLSVSEISDLARDRWMVPRSEHRLEFKNWRANMIPSLIQTGIHQSSYQGATELASVC